MISILTNHSAMAALQTLRMVSGGLEKTQNQVSTGYRVATASDNAAYWSIATTMRSDNKALSAVQDALGLGEAVVDVAYAGMSAVIDLVSEFKAKLVAAREPGIDKKKIDGELTQIKEQIRSVANSASFAGQNWLACVQDNSDSFLQDRKVVGGFVRYPNGNVAVNSIKVFDAYAPPWDHMQVYSVIDDTDGANTGDAGILTSDVYAAILGTSKNWVMMHTLGNPDPALGTEMTLSDATTGAEIEEMISVVDVMESRLVHWGAHLGAAQKRISMQEDFVAKLSGTIERGIGRLVDADMNEASTRLKALQTQQQLAVQSLQIANSQPETILQLFN